MPIKITGLTSGSTTIKAPDTGTDTTFTYPVASGEMSLKDNHPVPNDCINGTFEIWQRATNQASMNGMYSDDRWQNLASGGSTGSHTRTEFTLGQTDVPGNPRYYSSTTFSTGGTTTSYAYKTYRFLDVRRYAGKRVCIKFHAKADTSLSVGIDFGQLFDGGSANVYGAGQKINLTTSWAKYVLFFDIPSVAGKTMGEYSASHLVFWLDAGSSFDVYTDSLGNQSGTIHISEVESYISDIELPVIRRTNNQEYKECLAYYYKTNTNATTQGYVYTTTAMYCNSIYYPVPMVKTPTVTFNTSALIGGGASATLSSVQTDTASNVHCRLVATLANGTATASGYIYYQIEINGEI